MFDPAEFAVLANKLIEDSGFDSEARSRSAVSRAYYSLFLALRSSVLAANQRPIHGRGEKVDHGRFANSLLNHSDELDAIAMFLDELRTERTTADYVLEPGGRAPRCTKPNRAGRLVRRVEAHLRQLGQIDFSEVSYPP